MSNYRNYENLPNYIINASVDGYRLAINLMTSHYDINIFSKYLNEYELVYKVNEEQKIDLLLTSWEVGNCKTFEWLLNNEKYTIELNVLFNMLDNCVIPYDKFNEDKLLNMIKLLLSKNYKPSTMYINNFKKNGLIKCYELLQNINIETNKVI